MSERWCGHIRGENCNYKGKSGNDYGQRSDEWSFCPICGAPRPEKAKGLAEKLVEAGVKCVSIEMTGHSMAQAALEHFENLIDAVVDEYGMCGNVILKKRFRESL
jgi:hypothetical protein